jgi:hypothetical protein
MGLVGEWLSSRYACHVCEPVVRVWRLPDGGYKASFARILRGPLEPAQLTPAMVEAAQAVPGVVGVRLEPADRIVFAGRCPKRSVMDQLVAAVCDVMGVFLRHMPAYERVTADELPAADLALLLRGG